MQWACDAEAYLAWEESQAEKHDYIRGEVFAMGGCAARARGGGRQRIRCP